MSEVAFSGVRWRTPILVISPHLDDAVLGAGNLLEALGSQCSVVTVFAGNAGNWTTLTDWDRDCGFAVGDDVVERRRVEDRAALSRLSCAPIWLDFLDDQYAGGVRPEVDVLATAIVEQARHEEVKTIVWPLGILDSDHERVAAAAPLVHWELPELDWYSYGDLPYSYMTDGPQRTEFALRQLQVGGFQPRAIPGSAASDGKRGSVNCYPSQKTGWRSLAKLAVRRELYWKIVPDTAQPS